MDKARLLTRTAIAQTRIRDAALRMTQDIELHTRITGVTARGPVGACLMLEAVADALEAISPVPVVEVVAPPADPVDDDAVTTDDDAEPVTEPVTEPDTDAPFTDADVPAPNTAPNTARRKR